MHTNSRTLKHNDYCSNLIQLQPRFLGLPQKYVIYNELQLLPLLDHERVVTYTPHLCLLPEKASKTTLCVKLNELYSSISRQDNHQL